MDRGIGPRLRYPRHSEIPLASKEVAGHSPYWRLSVPCTCKLDHRPYPEDVMENGSASAKLGMNPCQPTVIPDINLDLCAP